MKIEFDYIIENGGGAVAKLSARNFQKEFDASFLHNSLASIIYAAIGLLTDKTRITIPFFSEPGEHQIVIEKIDDDNIEQELRWYDDYASWNMIDPNKYKSLYKGKTTLKSFIINAYNSAKRIINENGMEGYAEKWRRAFPIDDFKRLESLIKI
jgi:hypothetical protein